MKKLLMTALLAITMAPLAAYARPVRVIVGPRFVGPAPVRVWVGPRFVGPRFGWGWSSYWGPGYYAPYWAPAPYAYNYGYGYANPAAPTGAVKFDTPDKDAQVYVNGAYAGTVGDLKTMDLQAGTYSIGIQVPGAAMFDQKVYVAPGETVHLNPDLRSYAQPQGQQ